VLRSPSAWVRDFETVPKSNIFFIFAAVNRDPKTKVYTAKMNLRIFFIGVFSLPIITFFMCSCKSSEKSNGNKPKNTEIVSGQESSHQVAVRAPVIIYKTTKDYFYNVPVDLSEDRTMITSYPDISDIYIEGTLAYPTRLEEGFLLDNRGIGPNSAFIKFTYEEYSKLKTTPSPDMLYNLITDKEPFSAMYKLNCKRDTSEINIIIRSGLKENCKKIK
jgi:hypothetical protein